MNSRSQGFLAQLRARFGTVSPDIETNIGGDDELTFEDWRQGLYPERPRMVKETHVRTGYPLPEYVRLTHMTRVFPSHEDQLRSRLIDMIGAESRSIHQGMKSDDPKTRRKAGRDWYDRIRAHIRALRPNAGQDDDLSGDTSDALSRVRVLAETLSEDRPDRLEDTDPARTASRDQIRRLDQLFETGGPLNASDEALALFQSHYPDANRKNFRPYKPGGRNDVRWFNFWKLDGAASIPRRLRMNWELFGRSQNFTLYEDFKQKHAQFDESYLHDHEGDIGEVAGETVPTGFFTPCANGQGTLGELELNTAWTAADTFQEQISRGFGSKEAPAEPIDFEWQGHLAVASHYWLFPVQHLLSSLEPDMAQVIADGLKRSVARPEIDLTSNEYSTLARAITRLAKQVFHFPDKTAYDDLRKDVVVSRVFHGRAILISDLRPYSRSKQDWELATRAIVLDIDLTSEQRGRLMRACTEIATSRTLALRDIGYVAAINRTIDDIALGLSHCHSNILNITIQPPEATGGNIWHEPRPGEPQDAFQLTDEERRNYGAEFSRTLIRLRQLFANLGSLNHFMTHGITGARLDCEENRKAVEERVLTLRELRMPGFETLDEYLYRFKRATYSIDRMSARDDSLRRRITEYLQLVRAELELLQFDTMLDKQDDQDQANRRMNIVVILGTVLALVEVVGAPDMIVSLPDPVKFIGAGVILGVVWLYTRGKRNLRRRGRRPRR